MKVGVVKLGARITWETDAAVAPGEAISICKALVRGGAEVHVFTKLLKKDTLHPSMAWHDIENADQADLDALDLVVVINGNVNFFGGAEDRAQILNYSVVNNFKGPVVYVMCDPELPMMQIWENVSKKPWGDQYREADVLVRREVHLLSQPFATKLVRQSWLSTKRAVPLGQVLHFPMERFPLLNDWLDPVERPTVDLLYGGTARGGRRIPNLYKWYCGLPDDLRVEVFGSIDAADFAKHPKVGKEPVKRYPTFTGKVRYGEVLPKMNSALAHLATGDPSYDTLDLVPQRVAECIAAGNVVFVDARMDTSRRIYPVGTAANDFLYVHTQADLVERLRALKTDPDLRTQIIQEQRDAACFDADVFCQSLVQTLARL